MRRYRYRTPGHPRRRAASLQGFRTALRARLRHYLRRVLVQNTHRRPSVVWRSTLHPNTRPHRSLAPRPGIPPGCGIAHTPALLWPHRALGWSPRGTRPRDRYPRNSPGSTALPRISRLLPTMARFPPLRYPRYASLAQLLPYGFSLLRRQFRPPLEHRVKRHGDPSRIPTTPYRLFSQSL